MHFHAFKGVYAASYVIIIQDVKIQKIISNVSV